MQVNDRTRNQRSIGLIAGICFVAQLALSPYLAIGAGHPNFMTVFAVVIALSIGGRTAVIMGFVAGLVFDLSSTGPIGLMALLLTIASYVLGTEVRDRMSDDVGESIVPAVVALVSASGLYCLATLLTGQSDSFVDAFVYRALPTAFLTVVAYLPFAFAMGRGRKSPGKSLGGRKASRLDVPR